jgi:predicted Rossmann fold flavoprotein
MKKHYDTIIIGAGPAGLIAGYFAKQNGENIAILERNEKIGRKLMVTGKGRCNISNYTTSLKDLVSKYRKNEKFLYHAFSEFGVTETLEFFKKIGIDTKVERGNRVFPTTEKSLDVIDAFFYKLKDDLITECDVKDIEFKDSQITKVITDKGEFSADRYILATGGKSYPQTGSDGFGYELAGKLGHTISTPKPALMALKINAPFLVDLAGLSLKNVTLNIFVNNKKVESRFGEMLFTHEGISGPIVIDVSREVGKLLEESSEPVIAQIDVKPALSFPQLKERINKDLQEAGNKEIRNSLDHLLPRSLIPVFLSLCDIDPYTMASQLSKEEKGSLLHILKEFNLEVSGTEGWERAVVTDGGVNVKEIDPKTMKSKLINNLYFAGEIIDVYGPTGGYNLQMCWSTGYLAGIS